MATTLQKVIKGRVLSVVAAEDITAGKPVTAGGNIAAADAHMLGIAMNEVLTGQDLGVLADGQCEVIAGGAIAALSYVKVGAGGKFLAADAAALAAGKVVGKAVTAAAANNDPVTILILL